MKVYLIVALSVCLGIGNGCKNISNEPIIIKVQAKGIPAKRLYISDAYNWEAFLDSADYVDGAFTFRYRTDSSFEPFPAIISFINQKGNIETLTYFNPFLSTKKKQFSGSTFVLEQKPISIDGDFHADRGISIQAGKETDLLFKIQLIDFGYIGKGDSSARSATIKKYCKLINENPSSYLLMRGIFNNKEQYSKQELSTYLSLFSEKVQHSQIAHKLKTYVSLRSEPGMPLINLVLSTSKHESKSIIDTNAKLNMLVFWASWCGPCLMEIPYLKDIHAKLADKGLNMVSISMDKDNEMWKKALVQQKMTWDQFIVNTIQKDSVEGIFNFSAIPTIVITDSAGNEILQSTGFDENHMQGFEKYISGYLNKK